VCHQRVVASLVWGATIRAVTIAKTMSPKAPAVDYHQRCRSRSATRAHAPLPFTPGPLIVIASPPAFPLALVLNGTRDDRLSAFGHIEMLDCHCLLTAIA
jgi:hypothetical protein